MGRCPLAWTAADCLASPSPRWQPAKGWRSPQGRHGLAQGLARVPAEDSRCVGPQRRSGADSCSPRPTTPLVREPALRLSDAWRLHGREAESAGPQVWAGERWTTRARTESAGPCGPLHPAGAGNHIIALPVNQMNGSALSRWRSRFHNTAWSRPGYCHGRCLGNARASFTPGS